MAGYENIKDYGFDKRTAEERRELAIKAGKASGKTRRRKAALRDTMNKLLTMRVEVPELSEILRADGGESTYEEVITMAMIQKAMLGDVSAFNAIRDTVGQTKKSELDQEEQEARIDQVKARTEVLKAKSQVGDQEEIADDGFLEALKGTAAEDWIDDEEN